MKRLDLIDKKILVQLDLNSRQPNNSIAKKLRISREKVDYRIKRLVKEKIIKKFPAIINPTKFGYSMHKLYFQFQNRTPEIEKQITSWLVKNPFVQWVTDCKGKWDMNIIVFAHDVEHFNSIMQEFYNTFGSYIYSQHFNITLAVGNMEKGWILKDKKHMSRVLYTANEREDVGLEEIDLEILKTIANNARMPITEIAKLLSITTRIAQYRLKRLEQKGVIIGYTVSLDYNILKKQFYKVIFYINVITDTLKKKITTYCQMRHDMPFFIFSVGEWPFEVEYVVDDIHEFYAAIEDIKATFPEITRHESIWLAKEHKFDFMPLCYKPSQP